MQTLSGSEKTDPKGRPCSASSISNCSSQYCDSRPHAYASLHVPSPHRRMRQLRAASWQEQLIAWSSRQPEQRQKQVTLLTNKMKIQLSTWLIILPLFLLLLYSFSEKKVNLSILFGIHLQSLEFYISIFLITIKTFLRKINEWGLLKVKNKFRAMIMVMVLWVYAYLQTHQVVCIKYVQLNAYQSHLHKAVLN